MSIVRSSRIPSLFQTPVEKKLNNQGSFLSVTPSCQAERTGTELLVISFHYKERHAAPSFAPFHCIWSKFRPTLSIKQPQTFQFTEFALGSISNVSVKPHAGVCTWSFCDDSFWMDPMSWTVMKIDWWPRDKASGEEKNGNGKVYVGDDAAASARNLLSVCLSPFLSHT